MFKFQSMHYSQKPNPFKPKQPAGLPKGLKIDPYFLAYGLMAALVAIRLIIAAAGYFAGVDPIANVGDTLTFSSSNIAPQPNLVVIASTATDPKSTCRLELPVLQSFGDIVTVRAVQPDGVVASWSGTKTADSETCPSNTLITIRSADYESLSSAQIAPPSR